MPPGLRRTAGQLWPCTTPRRAGSDFGPDPHAEYEARHRRGIDWAATGDCIRGSQPAKITPQRNLHEADEPSQLAIGSECRLPAFANLRDRGADGWRVRVVRFPRQFGASTGSPGRSSVLCPGTTEIHPRTARVLLLRGNSPSRHNQGIGARCDAPERELGIPGPSAACRLQAPQPRKRGRWGARCRAAPFGRGRREQGSFWRSVRKKGPIGARRGPFFRERGMPGPLVVMIVLRR